MCTISHYDFGLEANKKDSNGPFIGICVHGYEVDGFHELFLKYDVDGFHAVFLNFTTTMAGISKSEREPGKRFSSTTQQMENYWIMKHVNFTFNMRQKFVRSLGWKLTYCSMQRWPQNYFDRYVVVFLLAL